jgi:hypothetical protein
LALADGCVLLIDEGYVLDDQQYGKQVLDTIVEKVLGTPGGDIAVVLIGYEKQKSKMLRDQYAGLSRRFNLTCYALRFVDYTDAALANIQQDLQSRKCQGLRRREVCGCEAARQAAIGSSGLCILGSTSTCDVEAIQRDCVHFLGYPFCGLRNVCCCNERQFQWHR